MTSEFNHGDKKKGFSMKVDDKKNVILEVWNGDKRASVDMRLDDVDMLIGHFVPDGWMRQFREVVRTYAHVSDLEGQWKMAHELMTYRLAELGVETGGPKPRHQVKKPEFFDALEKKLREVEVKYLAEGVKPDAGEGE